MAGYPQRKEFYSSLHPLKSHGLVLVGGGAAGKSLGGVSTKLTVSCSRNTVELSDTCRAIVTITT